MFAVILIGLFWFVGLSWLLALLCHEAAAFAETTWHVSSRTNFRD